MLSWNILQLPLQLDLILCISSKIEMYDLLGKHRVGKSEIILIPLQKLILSFVIKIRQVLDRLGR